MFICVVVFFFQFQLATVICRDQHQCSVIDGPDGVNVCLELQVTSAAGALVAQLATCHIAFRVANASTTGT